MRLDDDQERVVNLNEGYYAVLAGAGSGKSTVLLHRTGRLYDGAKRIICVTFTSEAAKNLRDRSAKLFPSVSNSSFSTLHSLALKFAFQHPDAFPFHLADNPLAEEGLSARAVFDAIGDTINFRAFTSWVSLQKRNRVSPVEAVAHAERTGKKLDYAVGYKRYQNLLKKQGILDFDDLIYFMVEILETRIDIRLQWQYDYVMQDEAQDACELDWRLLQLLTEKYKNLLCVGDSGQALYGFRGGAAYHLLNMEAMFPGTQTLVLGNNYRSLPAIVEAGKKAYPYPSLATQFKAIREGLGTISTTPYSNELREAEEVVLKARSYVAEETAVLARTNLALRPFEEACLELGVQYHLLGDSGFWESAEVQNVLYYLRCVVAPTEVAIYGAIRSPFGPTKYVSKKKVIERLKTMTKHGLTAYEAVGHVPELSLFKDFLRQSFHLRHVSANEAVLYLIQHLKALDHYKDEDNINPDRNPIENLKELTRAAKKHGTPADFVEFLRKLSYATKQRKGLCLSTIHQVKGREYKNVFLVSCNEGILPHAKAVDDLNGEKCCFFVAISRARDVLHISYHNTPSRFLQPFLREEIIEKDLYQVSKE